MNTAHNDPRSQWQRSGGQQYDGRSYSHTNGAPRQGDRFFSWIRESRLARSQERWVGGVCGGIAEYLGWSPTLVRAVMLASVLVYGFGAAFYAIAWFFMPDGANGIVLAQQLLNGMWDWVMLAPLFCLAVAIIMPGFGLAVTAIAGLAFFLLVNTRVHHWRRMPPYTAPGTQPFNNNGSGYAMSDGPTQTDQAYAYTGPSPQQPMPPHEYTRPNDPGQSSTAPQFASRQSNGADGPYADQQPSGSRHYDTIQPFDGQQPHVTQPTMARQSFGDARSYAPVRSRAPRREPAGFAMVLIVMAAMFLTIAGVLLSSQGTNAYLEPLLRSSLFGVAGICIGIGLIMLVLGLLGRRAGGLIPLAWISAIIAVCMLVAGVEYANIFADMNRTDATYTKVFVQGYRTFGADDQQMSQLRHGMAFQGSSPLNGSAANIDLSRYADLHGTHKLSVGQAGKITTVQSGCPTGVINLTAYKTQVFVTLPDDCSYRLGDASGDDYGIQSSLGGRYSIIRMRQGSSQTYFGFEDWEPRSESPSASGDPYRWLHDPNSMPTNGPELVIDPSHVMDATVTVQYQSESRLPSHTTTNDKESR